jgi:hypothetical protein
MLTTALGIGFPDGSTTMPFDKLFTEDRVKHDDANIIASNAATTRIRLRSDIFIIDSPVIEPYMIQFVNEFIPR